MALLASIDKDFPNGRALWSRLETLRTQPGNGQLALIEVPITADASAGKTFTVPFPCKVIEALAICKAANTAGTLQLRRSSTTISAAIVCAVNDTIARSATLVAAELTLNQYTTYNVLAGGTDATATRGVLQLYVVRI